jgi:hypothetical protein
MSGESLANAVTRSAPLTGQVKIAVTGVAVQLPDKITTNGIEITNCGTTAILWGGADVTNVADGTGNGYVLAAGATASTATDNANRIWVNGTAGGWISFLGS